MGRNYKEFWRIFTFSPVPNLNTGGHIFFSYHDTLNFYFPVLNNGRFKANSKRENACRFGTVVNRFR